MQTQLVDGLFDELEKIAKTFTPVSRLKVRAMKAGKKALEKAPKSALFGAAGAGASLSSSVKKEKHERLSDERARLTPEESKKLRNKRIEKEYLPSLLQAATVGSVVPSSTRMLKKTISREMEKATRPAARAAGEEFGKGVFTGPARAVKNVFRRRKHV